MNLDQKGIENLLIDTVREHFDDQRCGIDAFIHKRFRYPGCWHTNKRAFGFDLLRAPLNLLWAPVYIVIVLMLLALRFLGVRQAASISARLPAGMTTKVQTFVNSEVDRELIQTEALKQKMVAQLLNNQDIHVDSDEARLLKKRLDDIVEQSLKQLMLTRTASADISNTLFSAAVGAVFFKKFTPGGFGLGFILAVLWAEHQAEKNFFLGPTVGSWYYSMFSAKPTVWESLIGVVIVIAGLAVIASFSGLLTDPIQAKAGLHKRRLSKLLTQLEKDVIEKMQSRFKPLDPYIARILELFDTLKTQLSI